MDAGEGLIYSIDFDVKMTRFLKHVTLGKSGRPSSALQQTHVTGILGFLFYKSPGIPYAHVILPGNN